PIFTTSSEMVGAAKAGAAHRAANRQVKGSNFFACMGSLLVGMGELAVELTNVKSFIFFRVELLLEPGLGAVVELGPEVGDAGCVLAGLAGGQCHSEYVPGRVAHG